jgi:methyl-accepting chemotaxis protein
MLRQLFLPYQNDLPPGLQKALAEDNRTADRFMLGLLFLHWVIASTVMAYSHGAYLLGFVAGGLTFGTALAAYWLFPGQAVSRTVIAVSLMVFSAIFIQQHLGRIEMHFHIFAALAFLLRYRDAVPVLAAVVTTALHHLVFNYCQVNGVALFGSDLMVFNYGTGLDIVFLHAAFVVVEAVVLLLILQDQLSQFAATEEISRAVRKLQEENDLSLRISEGLAGDGNSAVGSFNRLLERLEDMFRDWRSKADRLASASEELSAVSDNLKRSADASSQRVEQVAGSVQEVNNVVQDVANNIGEVSQSASKSTETTRQGTEAVDAAARQIQELSGSAHRVDEIVTSIESIAKKTDLLALNAAIEAANAGEAGQGFAVVADEVRKLADQTSHATGQVNEILSTLRGQSESSVAAMDEVRSVMQQVETEIEQTDQVANQIAAAAEELAATMNETTENIGEISANVETVSASVGETERSAQDLGEMAQGLQGSLSTFRTSG